MDRRRFTQFAGFSLAGAGLVSTPAAFFAEACAAANRIMARYSVTDLDETARTAAAHLRALAGVDRPSRQVDQWAMHEAKAMHAVIYGDAMADLGRLDEALPALDTAEAHAFEIGHRGLLAWIAGTRAQGHLELADPAAALDVIRTVLPLVDDSPAASRLYAIGARAYAVRGGGAEAASALWLVTRTLDKHAGDADVFGMPFRTMSHAEAACNAAETFAILGQDDRVRELAETWTPIADAANHIAVRGHLRGSHAIALARSEPEQGAALMAWQLAEASAFGEPGVGVHRKVRLFLERAAPTASVRDVAEMYRTLCPSEGVTQAV